MIRTLSTNRSQTLDRVIPQPHAKPVPEPPRALCYNRACMLTRIHIDNYKCLTNFELVFSHSDRELKLYRDDGRGFTYPFGLFRSALATETDEQPLFASASIS